MLGPCCAGDRGAGECDALVGYAGEICAPIQACATFCQQRSAVSNSLWHDVGLNAPSCPSHVLVAQAESDLGDRNLHQAFLETALPQLFVVLAGTGNMQGVGNGDVSAHWSGRVNQVRCYCRRQ